MAKVGVTDRNQFGIAGDKSQVFKFTNPDFAAFITFNGLKKNMRYAITDHWHDEVEFIYVTKGSMKYSIEGEIITLREEEGVIVNSRKLHVGLSDNGAANDSYCVILHPMLLSVSKYMDQTYIEPIIKNPNLPYIKLSREVDWQGRILDDIKAIYDSKTVKYGEIKVVELFFNIWFNLYSNVPHEVEDNIRNNHHLVILKDMISYIHDHYKEKISLEDICSAGGVGKTMGTNIFNEYVNKTPGEFLKDYRIQKSIRLLQETDMTVTEICYETGFAGASYFAETFKKYMGKSPLEYRKEKTDYRTLMHYAGEE